MGLEPTTPPPPLLQLTREGDSSWAGALTGKIMTDNPVE